MLPKSPAPLSCVHARRMYPFDSHVRDLSPAIGTRKTRSLVRSPLPRDWRCLLGDSISGKKNSNGGLTGVHLRIHSNRREYESVPKRRTRESSTQEIGASLASCSQTNP